MVRLIKQDNLPDVFLKDNPEKYKYNPYTIYSEGVLFLVFIKRDRTYSSYRFYVK